MLALSSACSDDPVELPVSDRDGVLGGLVARQKTGVGLANVVVAVRTTGGEVVGATFTDLDGSFDFDGIPTGTYEVFLANLQAAGIDPLFDVVEPAVARVTVGDGVVDDVIFAVVGLVPARIVGDVMCERGLPSQATVRLVGGSIDKTVSTNMQGRYAALDLPPGHYSVFAETDACTLTDAIRVVSVLRGQFVEVDFEGEG